MSKGADAIDQRDLPTFLYGTAWKEEETQWLTELALNQGFRGIDTANQRKHYFEAAVGNGITSAIRRGIVIRDDLFLQTKFTFLNGQDHRLPYDPAAPIATQVEQSFASSLEHLNTDYVDAYLLHGPSQREGLGKDDWSAWKSMEEIYDSGRAKSLGISNVSIDQLQTLCKQARIRPRFVQNRCYASRDWDRLVRDFCMTNGMIYQGFSLLTANRDVLTRPELAAIARHHERSVTQILFRFAIELGILPLTGTTNADHMRADLDSLNFRLESTEVNQLVFHPSR